MQMSWKILTLILAFLTGAFQFVLDYSWADKDKRTFKIVRGALFFVMLAAMLFSIITVLLDDREAKEAAKKHISPEIQVKDSNRLLIENQKKNEEIVRLNRVIASKSMEIAELSRVIASYFVGGDSFCFVTIKSLTDGKTQPLFVLEHKGEYPLFDVFVRIVDLDKFRSIKDYTLESIESAEIRLNIGNVAPKQAHMLGSCQLPEKDEKDFNVFISARNGFIIEFIRLRRVNGIWQPAIRVLRDTDKKILLEEVSPDFPRDKDGTIKWGKSLS